MGHTPAVLGGAPAFPAVYHLVRPRAPDPVALNGRLERLCRTRMFSNQGEHVGELERCLAERAGVRHCACFANGTVALMAVLRAVEATGSVIVPSFTFAATVQAVSWCGLTPCFAEIDPATLMLDPAAVSGAVAADTVAVMPVHLFGGSCDHAGLRRAAGSLPLVYDAAQAFGATWRSRPVTALGDASVISMHATKPFHCGEGGAVFTDDPDLDRRVCRVRNFGFEGYLNSAVLGLNGKMSELTAILGLALLDGVDTELAARARLDVAMRDLLAVIPGIGFPCPTPGTVSSHAYLPLILDPAILGLDAVELHWALMAENIVSRCYFFPPVHRTRYYAARAEGRAADLPLTDCAARRVLCLPFHGSMTAAEMETIVAAVAACQAHAPAVHAAVRDQVPYDWAELTRDRVEDAYEAHLAH